MSDIQTVQAIFSLFSEIANDFDVRHGGGDLSPSAYDTAWLTRLRQPHDDQSLLFPTSFRWLVENQNPDGSWSNPFPHTLIPTLSVLYALLLLPERYALQAKAAIDKAIAYLHQNLASWRAVDHESIAFELLFPYYVDKLAKHGVSLQISALNVSALTEARQRKLARVNLAELVAGNSSLLYAFEALADHFDAGQMAAILAPQGHVGHSPAATAAWMLKCGLNDRSVQWLSHLVNTMDGAVPVTYPLDGMEPVWSLLMLKRYAARFGPEEREPLLDRIEDWLTEKGFAWSLNCSIPANGDETSAALAVLADYGRPRAPNQLLGFEGANNIVCWKEERNPSVSANAHALDALFANPAMDWTPRLVDKCTQFLISSRRPDGSYLDKWHVSPLYAVRAVITALQRHPEPAIRAETKPTVDWLLQSQRADGGWGLWQSTAEETAYAILALDVVEPEQRITHAMTRGRAWLDAFENHPRPDLYISKQLYGPHRIVQAAVLGAHLVTDRLL